MLSQIAVPRPHTLSITLPWYRLPKWGFSFPGGLIWSSTPLFSPCFLKLVFFLSSSKKASVIAWHIAHIIDSLPISSLRFFSQRVEGGVSMATVLQFYFGFGGYIDILPRLVLSSWFEPHIVWRQRGYFFNKASRASKWSSCLSLLSNWDCRHMPTTGHDSLILSQCWNLQWG